MFEDISDITQAAYQKRAEQCVTQFLQKFQTSLRPQQLAVFNEHDTPFTLRVTKNPPSLQIKQLPHGGTAAGELRIREKLSPVTKRTLVVAGAQDLTRECIVVMLHDQTINTILQSGLLAPEQIAAVLESLRIDSPEMFVVVQRYIIGIERFDGLCVPYKIVPADDEETFEYLNRLPYELL